MLHNSEGGKNNLGKSVQKSPSSREEESHTAIHTSQLHQPVPPSPLYTHPSSIAPHAKKIYHLPSPLAIASHPLAITLPITSSCSCLFLASFSSSSVLFARKREEEPVRLPVMEERPPDSRRPETSCSRRGGVSKRKWMEKREGSREAHGFGERTRERRGGGEAAKWIEVSAILPAANAFVQD